MSYADIDGFQLVEPAVIPDEVQAVMDRLPEDVREKIASGRIRFEVSKGGGSDEGETIILIHDDAYGPERLADRLMADVQRLAESLNAIHSESAHVKLNVQETMARLEPFRLEKPRIGRNHPCPCGSDRKYKFCCMRKNA